MHSELEQEIAALLGSALEARHLIQAAVECGKMNVVRSWAQERARGVPLAYLTGKKGFWKNEFLVEPGILIPRPETEHVLEVALARGRQVLNFADLGCGSGCLGLSLLKEIKTATLWTVDSSALACAVTQKNAKALGLEARVVQSEVVAWRPPVQFELIVANPPYVALGDMNVQDSVHAFEPHAALYSGADGLDAIRAWSAWASRHLALGGVFVCEIGAGQMSAAREIMLGLQLEKIEIDKDLAGHERVISAERVR